MACLVQAFCGHRRAIMEGPTGLWWGAILTITLGEASRGTPLNDIASSLSGRDRDLRNGDDIYRH
ncbi:purine permease ybbY [Salmonella enterica subsp. enterica]|uniref:Purine permease ybbY n=1 Tax=Salmonella enterica I TaxID=59201 RepID=A0A447U850_SALET|nr:purine permease ybbY [Salmonella enterica subsp. enterica]